MIVPGSYVSVLWNKPVDLDKKADFFKIYNFRGSGNLPCSMVGHLLAGELISSLLITLKQNQVKVAPAFADRAWQHLQMPWL